MSYRRLWFATVVSLAGCSAVKTTFVDVDSKGTFIENPCGCVHGVPSVVKVATHIEVSISQTDFWRIEQTAESPHKKLVHMPGAVVRTVGVEQVMTDKVVMVDPKRPLSGEGEFSIDFKKDGSGQIQAVNYKAIDETIKDSAALVTAALKVFRATATDASSVGGTKSDVLKVTRVIALERFPVGQCTQAEIERFVGQYINSCTPLDCSMPTGYALAPN